MCWPMAELVEGRVRNISDLNPPIDFLNKHFEGSRELLRFDAFALPELLL